jgi:hypothetical protein
MGKRRAPPTLVTWARAVIAEDYYESGRLITSERMERHLEEFRRSPPKHMDIPVVCGGTIRHRLSSADLAKRKAMDRARSKRRRR